MSINSISFREEYAILLPAFVACPFHPIIMLGLVRKCRRSVKVTAVKLYITSYMGMICSTRTTNDIIRALAGSRSDDNSRFTPRQIA